MNKILIVESYKWTKGPHKIEILKLLKEGFGINYKKQTASLGKSILFWFL